ncbi:MAG: topoisomerase protein [Candidatus Magasanikbacteria bacterium GW2011_GWA2_37_8]|uniref:DNA topoisomerase 1 n=1 Tax=Candidatus Magasanikbacteria bacterium GW2011_GWA2_37_8 TaxID=1619036 RepID=A0A0G0KIQ3_9BACT|nr:MAG: topoisomerase protein [Candidatus Magasanikbacteria bacterium GW2011_GWA2_37_8]
MSILVIVESPTKAKTITKFLGKGYVVKSSFGHVRDLPKSKMGIDIANGFIPDYVVSRDKTKVVKELKTAAKKAKDILFASDEDREGEAISWHLAHILDILPKDAKRITFHEITKHAIEEALKHPRPLDLKLVDAQQARRVLDRLVGYELSPFLWRKVAKGLSAGRVQSVAVRLIVEREREIENFKTEEYWTILGLFEKEQIFEAKLHVLDGKKLDKMDLATKDQVDAILTKLNGARYTIGSVEEKPTKRFPAPPFTTSTLQQDANNRLGFSSKQTMRLAQQLYEGVELGSAGSVGLITYMRTDSVNLAEKFLTEAKNIITTDFGDKYTLTTPRNYKNKSKNAQEAHEAIRPTDPAQTPDMVKPFLDKNQFRLYELLSPDRAKENILPTLKVDEPINCTELKPEQHFTEPPARYSDATLVKVLEEYGIGRPSTYAPTLATIEDRGYVERDEKKKLKPKEIALVVNDLLVEHFPQIVDYQFTAQMEENLDAIARGEKDWQPIIATFYEPFKANLKEKDATLDKKEITESTTDEVCDKCAKPMIIKMGRFGKFMACSGYPDCKNIKSINKDGTIAAVEPELTNEVCEKCGAPMVKKMGRFGPFLSCSTYPKCKGIKNIEKKTDLVCPECNTGQIIEKRSKRGKIFYACNRYPECKYALWDKPTGEKCPTCQKPLVYGTKGTTKCSDKECSYKPE